MKNLEIHFVIYALVCSAPGQDAGILVHVGQDYHFSSANPSKAAITSAVPLVCFTRHRSEFTLLAEGEPKYIEKETERNRENASERDQNISKFHIRKPVCSFALRELH